MLGGTSEAAALARRLAHLDGLETIVSFAGRTEAPELPETGARIETRIGGFGGTAAMASYLAENAIDIIVDATHPFATGISANAVEAAAVAGIPSLRLDRPPWTPGPGDNWRIVDDEGEAAALLPAGARAFLALGAQRVAAFDSRQDVFRVARVVDRPPASPLAGPHLVVTGRGPFDLASELALLREHAITHIVARNSGGEGARAKLLAARELCLPVIMIRRPPAPHAAETTVASVDDAMRAILRLTS